MSLDFHPPKPKLSNIYKGIADSLSSSILESEYQNTEIKLEWLESLGHTDLNSIYQKFPILKTYLEHHKNTHGDNISLEGRPYLLPMLLDDADEIVVQKAVQTGLTEIAVCKALHLAIQGLHALYVLPSHPSRNRFVANRIDKVLEESSYYRDKTLKRIAPGVKAPDSRGLKAIGRGVVHFVGSNTKAEFSEFPADYLVIDEQDLAEAKNISLAEDRLAESSYKKKLRISNPRRPGAYHAVERSYGASDQKVWEVKCNSCETFQELKWLEHFVNKVDDGVYELRTETGEPVCSHCGETFDRLGEGQWTPLNPGAVISGYKMSRLYVPSSDIKSMYGRFLEALLDETAIQTFHASELGEYYIPKTSKVTLEILRGCLNPDAKDWYRYKTIPEGQGKNSEPVRDETMTIVMGVDVGSVLHYKASRINPETYSREALMIGTASTWGELREIVDEIEPDAVVIDAKPEVHKAQEFADESLYPVYLCNFGSPEMTEAWRVNLDKEPPIITANRTAVMDAALQDMLRGKMHLPAPAEYMEDFFEQMQTPVRQFDPVRERFIWTKGNDHYRLTDVYEWIASELVDSFEPAIINEDDTI